VDPIPLGVALPWWSVLPFAGFLLSIALFPLVVPRFWSRHYGKVGGVFGVPVAAWFLFNAPGELFHTAVEFVSFIVLLGSLYIISGGILVRGTIRGTPAVNCAFLGIGAVIANVLGTTGASMVLIRPLLRANAHRKNAAHVYVFFIFIVANIGGLLTPIGDPPLFLGYLRGVPFFWTVKSLWPLWALTTAIVVGIFYVLERLAVRREEEEGSGDGGDGTAPLSLEGKWNLLLLGIAVGAVFLPAPAREIAMAAAAAFSVRKTPARIREENGFTYRPIEEVAVLFAAIFATMIPALLILKARGGEMGVMTARHYFWATGMLSGFLDNAPTYLAFLSLAQGIGGTPDVAGVPAPVLEAVSAGAVFMGANTYIGNAPNFMVKAIAEGAGVRMPSFLGYMTYSATILLPTFALVAWLFF
jgi:Na+/H+ antiporter NhaD/arsenite permease-like protein